MMTILLTAHTLIVVFLVVVILMQKSDGAGGLAGMGGGGGGGFMTGRGVANALTRSTSVLAALFFASSLGLAMLANEGETFTDAATELTGEEVFVPEDGEIRDSGDLLDVFDTSTTTPAELTSDELIPDGTAPDIIDDPLDALDGSDAPAQTGTQTDDAETTEQEQPEQ